MKISQNTKNLLHGLVVAVGTAIVGVVVPLLQAGTFPGKQQLINAGIIGIGAAVTYLFKIYVLGTSAIQEPPKP